MKGFTPRYNYSTRKKWGEISWIEIIKIVQEKYVFSITLHMKVENSK